MKTAFPRYWPFVRGFHRSPVNSPRKGPVTRSFDIFFDLRLNKRLIKPWKRRWFETPWCSLWRHCNVDSRRNMFMWDPGAHLHFKNVVLPVWVSWAFYLFNANLHTWKDRLLIETGRSVARHYYFVWRNSMKCIRCTEKSLVESFEVVCAVIIYSESLDHTLY